MRATLHDYQIRAVRLVERTKHCCLFLEMGLGKSLITLTAISRLIEDVCVKKVLVIAPRKVAESTWSDEVIKWDNLSWLRVSRVIGTAKQRAAALKKDADIYVVGRDSWVWLVKYYHAKMPFDMLVIDELTTFKSNTSQRFKAMRLVRSQFERIVGLTGTPAPNGYLDLWAEIFCVDGGQKLGKFITHYRTKYFILRTSQQGFILSATLREGAKKEIDNLLSDMCLTMQNKDYLSLPDRQDIVVNVTLSDAQRERYMKFEKDMVMQVNGEEQITAANAAALLGKLMQFSNGAIYNDEHDVEEIHQEKIESLREIVEASGSPVLVFYLFKHDVQRISEALKKSYKVREYKDESDLRDWNDGKIDVLLAHPSSCAYGLNMQRGGHIIVWFGVGYNLELYQQACARLHRQGQQHQVQIYHLLCDGTVDKKAWDALQGKAKTQDALLASLKELVKKHKAAQ